MRISLFLLVFSLMISGCAPGAASPRLTPTGPVRTPTTLPPTATLPAPTPSATTAPTATTPADTPTPPPTSAPSETATSLAPTLSAPTLTAPVVTAPTLTAPLPIVTTSPAAPAAEIARTGASGVPAFDHIILIVFENHNYKEVIGNKDMPNFNRLAQENVLLTRYYAVAHPSLPNYLAMIGGSTFGITTDCTGCFLDQPSLPDLIEASGRTWKTYQESMAEPCALGIDPGGYDQNHNPFVYFNPIRKDAERCDQSVVGLDQLNTDLSAGQLPNFSFIMPNLCNSGHDCGLAPADAWLGKIMDTLQSAPALGANSLIVITFDEASADHSTCCGLPAKAGGRIPAILISPQAKGGAQDDTPYSHYSLLKTILLAWNLPGLGESENPQTLPITSPWTQK